MTMSGERWPKLIGDLLANTRLSVRHICERSDLNRSSLRRYTRGDAHMRVDQLERLFDTLGYDLKVVKRDAKSGGR